MIQMQEILNKVTTQQGIENIVVNDIANEQIKK
jgi:hypothetical protein